MGHVARRVPLDWEHPKSASGDFIPMHNGHRLTERQAGWDAELKKWDEGFRDDFRGGWVRKGAEHDMDFSEWMGKRPDPADHTPEWPESECRGWMMYEDVTEGTPLSPVFDSPIKLAHWMADNYELVTGRSYDDWMHTILGPYRRARYNESRRLHRELGPETVEFIRKNLIEIYRQLVPQTDPVNNTEVQKALADEARSMMHHLITGMMIERANIVCDDSSNPRSVVDSGYPNLYIAILASNIPDIWCTIGIGPHAPQLDSRNFITLGQVYA